MDNKERLERARQCRANAMAALPQLREQRTALLALLAKVDKAISENEQTIFLVNIVDPDLPQGTNL